MNNSHEAKPVAPRFKAVYVKIAVITLNTLVILLLLNLSLAVFFHFQDTKTGRKHTGSYREKYADLDAYTTVSKVEANRFLDEQESMQKKGFAYKPWVQFANPHFDGHLLTTDTSGFRVTPGSIDRDSPVLVHVFGGSTTFGYGVPNSYTIPSQLQQSLNKRQLGKAFVVKNYGQGYYYSSQEILLFISVLKSGNIPKYAVFVDGANDTALLSKGVDQPRFTEITSEAWDLKNGRVEKPSWIPMMRLTQAIRQRVLGRTKSPADQKDRSALPEADAARYVVDRYRQNQRIIRALCKEYDVVPIFVWQPVPFFKYDRSLHRTFPYEDQVPKHWEMVYEDMARSSDLDLLYLGDMLDGVSEKVFVDDVHYNEKYNGLIAQAIAERIARNNDIGGQGKIAAHYAKTRK
jgi:hypothetical protein